MEPNTSFDRYSLRFFHCLRKHISWNHLGSTTTHFIQKIIRSYVSFHGWTTSLMKRRVHNHVSRFLKRNDAAEQRFNKLLASNSFSKLVLFVHI